MGERGRHVVDVVDGDDDGGAAVSRRDALVPGVHRHRQFGCVLAVELLVGDDLPAGQDVHPDLPGVGDDVLDLPVHPQVQVPGAHLRDDAPAVLVQRRRVHVLEEVGRVVVLVAHLNREVDGGVERDEARVLARDAHVDRTLNLPVERLDDDHFVLLDVQTLQLEHVAADVAAHDPVPARVGVEYGEMGHDGSGLGVLGHATGRQQVQIDGRSAVNRVCDDHLDRTLRDQRRAPSVHTLHHEVEGVPLDLLEAGDDENLSSCFIDVEIASETASLNGAESEVINTVFAAVGIERRHHHHHCPDGRRLVDADVVTAGDKDGTVVVHVKNGDVHKKTSGLGRRSAVRCRDNQLVAVARLSVQPPPHEQSDDLPPVQSIPHVQRERPPSCLQFVPLQRVDADVSVDGAVDGVGRVDGHVFRDAQRDGMHGENGGVVVHVVEIHVRAQLAEVLTVDGLDGHLQLEHAARDEAADGVPVKGVARVDLPCRVDDAEVAAERVALGEERVPQRAQRVRRQRRIEVHLVRNLANVRIACFLLNVEHNVLRVAKRHPRQQRHRGEHRTTSFHDRPRTSHSVNIWKRTDVNTWNDHYSIRISQHHHYHTNIITAVYNTCRSQLQHPRTRRLLPAVRARLYLDCTNSVLTSAKHKHKNTAYSRGNGRLLSCGKRLNGTNCFA